MHYKQHWLNWRIIVIEDTDLSFIAKALALYLNTYMNDSHNMAFPSLRRIEHDMRTTRKTIIKYLGELTEAGYLSQGKILSPSTSQYHNTYTALIPDKIKAAIGGGGDTPLENEGGVRPPNRWCTSSPKVVEEVHTNKQGNKQGNKQTGEAMEIPDEINPVSWMEFEQHRKEKKAKLSDLARKKAMNEIKHLSFEEQANCIDKTIQNNWTGLFSEKSNGTNGQVYKPAQSHHAKVVNMLRDRIAAEDD